MLNLKTDIYTTPIILGNFSVAKVIIIFGNNKHIKDFFEKKIIAYLEKRIIAYLEKRKSPCTVPRQIGNTARGIYNIGDIFSFLSQMKFYSSFHSQMRFQLNIYVTLSSNSTGRR